MNRQQLKGFTLMELMIVVAIIAVIAAVAIPFYQDYVVRSKRTEAKVALTGLAQLQESYYTRNNSYADTFIKLNCASKGLCKESGGNTYTVEGNYLLKVEDADATTFQLSAEPTGEQAVDTQCTKFTLDHRGTKGGTASGLDVVEDCWGR